MPELQTPYVEDVSEKQEAKPAEKACAPRFVLSLPSKVFWVFLCLYAITWGGHYTSGDGLQKVQWAKQLVSGGPYWTDTVTGGPPRYGIGHSLIAAPGLWLSKMLLEKTGFRTEAAFYTFLFVLNGALLMYLVARYLAGTYTAAQVWMTVVLIGMATSWWPYTKLDFTEPFVVTIFFLAFMLLRNGRDYSGFAVASFLLLLRADTFFLLGILILWRMTQAARGTILLRALCATMPVVALMIFVNYRRFGSILDAGYAGETFSNPLWIGLYGMLFSAGKSIFLFSPPLVLGFAGWKKFRNRWGHDAWLFLAVLACEVLLYSAWWGWSGDDCWGVRFVLPGVVLMTIPCVEILDRRIVATVVLAIGILVQLPAILLNGLDYLYLSKTTVDMERRRQGLQGWNRVDLDDIRFNPRYNQIAGTYEILRQRLGGSPMDVSENQQSRTGTPLSQAMKGIPKSQDCAVDLIWCRLRK